MKRIVVRLIGKSRKGEVDQVLEQEIEATHHDIGLLLRRDPFRNAVAHALVNNGTATFEVKR